MERQEAEDMGLSIINGSSERKEGDEHSFLFLSDHHHEEENDNLFTVRSHSLPP